MKMNRRKFLHALYAAGGTSALARPFGAFAQGYDLVIRGGRIIDPSLRINMIGDLAISGGTIAAVGNNISPGGADVIDAGGRLVLPGLIDVHSHYGRTELAAQIALSDGVTAFIDAGSAGADAIDEVAAVARTAPQTAGLLINIGREGVRGGGDTSDLALADVQAAKAGIARNRDIVVGVKARLTEGVTVNDVEVLRRAQDVASSFDLPVMIHMGQSATSMATLIQLLKPGDVVTHMFAPPPNAIVDANGRILPEILAARRRGIWFDIANGRIDHLRWDTYDSIMEAGFWPDTVSTDGSATSRNAPGVVDLPNIMSKLLNFGMTLEQSVACATWNASRVFPLFRDLGTLNVGARADITILELRQGTFEFLDNYENVRTGTQRLFPSATILGGRRVERI